MSRRSRFLSFLLFFSWMAWCCFRARWAEAELRASASLSCRRGRCLPPTLMVADGAVLFLWKRAASVFPWSKPMPLLARPLEWYLSRRYGGMQGRRNAGNGGVKIGGS